MDTPSRKNRPRGRGHWVYARRIWHKRAGRFVYPKHGRVFRFWVSDDKL